LPERQFTRKNGFWNEEARNMMGKIGSWERRKKKRTGIMRNLE
jgi:hypothetical protein